MSKEDLKNAQLIHINDVIGIRRAGVQALRKLEAQGFVVEQANIDWHTPDKFENILEELVAKTKLALKTHKRVVLIGSGAGGSMAINIMAKLRERRLFVVTICSRLVETDLSAWDKRSLERVAYIGKPNESRLYYDSVMHCTNVSVPKLSKPDKQRIVTAHLRADPSIPRQTMEIPGVKSIKLKGFNHANALAKSIQQLPKIYQILSDL